MGDRFSNADARAFEVERAEEEEAGTREEEDGGHDGSSGVEERSAIGRPRRDEGGRRWNVLVGLSCESESRIARGRSNNIMWRRWRGGERLKGTGGGGREREGEGMARLAARE